ncbi:hypothetical protein ACFC09_07995, partial [Streptomyces sp. NPDC056161]|uniref:hypothetical protein n=1 Tax=Streptomyces sp. NPDC056161 TaxID=3345732 RepID=UPI0035D6677E
MPPQDDDQQRRTHQSEEQRAVTAQDPPEVQRANDRAEFIQSPQNLMENARNAMQGVAAESLLAQVKESQNAEIAAMDVYQAYRQMYPELPTMPPPGLQVALHPASVKKVGGHPLIV